MQWVNRLGLLFDFLAFWLVAPEVFGERRLRELKRTLERVLSWLSQATLWALVLMVMAVASLVGASTLLRRGPYHDLQLPAWTGWGYLSGLAMSGLLTLCAAKVGPRQQPEHTLSEVLIPSVMAGALAALGLLGLSAFRAQLWSVGVLALSGVLIVDLLMVVTHRELPTTLVWSAIWASIMGWGAVLAALGWSTLVPVQRTPFLVLVLAMSAVPATGIVGFVIEPMLRILQDDGHIRRRFLALGAAFFVLGFVLQLAATF
jgi:hypothetical protein